MRGHGMNWQGGSGMRVVGWGVDWKGGGGVRVVGWRLIGRVVARQGVGGVVQGRGGAERVDGGVERGARGVAARMVVVGVRGEGRGGGGGTGGGGGGGGGRVEDEHVGRGVVVLGEEVVLRPGPRVPQHRLQITLSVSLHSLLSHSKRRREEKGIKKLEDAKRCEKKEEERMNLPPFPHPHQHH